MLANARIIVTSSFEACLASYGVVLILEPKISRRRLIAYQVERNFYRNAFKNFRRLCFSGGTKMG